jgi:hypothetical protein
MSRELEEPPKSKGATLTSQPASAVLAELASGWKMDNHLAALTAKAGESVSPEEMIELVAGAKAIFLTATLASRTLSRMRNCEVIWQGVLELFRQSSEAWRDIGGDPHTEAFRRQLARLIDLAGDRVMGSGGLVRSLVNGVKRTFVKAASTEVSLRISVREDRTSQISTAG